MIRSFIISLCLATVVRHASAQTNPSQIQRRSDGAAAAQPGTSQQPPSAAEIRDRIQSRFDPWLAAEAASGQFSGVVAVTHRGERIYAAAHGLSDRSRNVPITQDTRFNLASAGKMFTAIAVAQLVQRGTLRLDASVGTYLPELTNATLKDRVRLDHLLTHGSGLGGYFQRGFLADRVFVSSAADYLPFFVADSLRFEPGSATAYSNAGFALLGAIVERAAGVNYYDYLQANVFAPAGMRRTAFLDRRTRPADVAIGYTQDQSTREIRENWDFVDQRGGPAGGAYSSAEDMLRFCAALRSGTLIPESVFTRFTMQRVRVGPLDYGYGFIVNDRYAWREIGHSGAAPGANVEIATFPDGQLDVVVLANIDPLTASRVKRRLLDVIFARDSGAIRQPSHEAAGIL